MGQKGYAFDPVKDIPSLEGKVVVVTGSTFGLGRQAALDLSKHNPSQLWITGRNAERGKLVVNEINEIAPKVSTRFLELDLSSFDSIKKAAKSFLTSAPRLDILMLNAGLLAGPPGQSKEGYEIRWGVNHVGHALLLKLLTPLLLDTASTESSSDVRVIFLSSSGHQNAPSGGIRFETLKTPAENLSIPARYCQSKLANILYAREIAKKYPQFTTVSLNPGNIMTGLFSGEIGPLLRTIMVVDRVMWTIARFTIGVPVEEGAKNQLWAATAKDIKAGEYYDPVGVPGKRSKLSQDDELAKKLWDWTEKELDGQQI
jgi:retinol dehydrogenase 12